MYSFSTENWSRAADEVEALMELFAQRSQARSRAAEQGVRVRFIGRREGGARSREQMRRRKG